MPFSASRTLPLSTQCRVCGLALLVYAIVGLGVTIRLIFQQSPPGIEAEAEGRMHVSLAVVAVCAVSGLLGVVLSRISWHRSSEILESAEPATSRRVETHSGFWAWVWAGILAVIGVGMVGACTEQSFIDLSLGTAFLANFGAETLAMARQVRGLERARHVRYYCRQLDPLVADGLDSRAGVVLRFGNDMSVALQAKVMRQIAEVIVVVWLRLAVPFPALVARELWRR